MLRLAGPGIAGDEGEAKGGCTAPPIPSGGRSGWNDGFGRSVSIGVSTDAAPDEGTTGIEGGAAGGAGATGRDGRAGATVTWCLTVGAVASLAVSAPGLDGSVTEGVGVRAATSEIGASKTGMS